MVTQPERPDGRDGQLSRERDAVARADPGQLWGKVLLAGHRQRCALDTGDQGQQRTETGGRRPNDHDECGTAGAPADLQQRRGGGSESPAARSAPKGEPGGAAKLGTTTNASTAGVTRRSTLVSRAVRVMRSRFTPVRTMTAATATGISWPGETYRATIRAERGVKRSRP